MSWISFRPLLLKLPSVQFLPEVYTIKSNNSIDNNMAPLRTYICTPQRRAASAGKRPVNRMKCHLNLIVVRPSQRSVRISPPMSPRTSKVGTILCACWRKWTRRTVHNSTDSRTYLCVASPGCSCCVLKWPFLSRSIIDCIYNLFFSLFTYDENDDVRRRHLIACRLPRPG